MGIKSLERENIKRRRKQLMWRRKMINFASNFDAMWCLTGQANGQRGHNARRKAVAVRLICRGCGTVEIEQFDRTKIFGLHPVPRGECKVCLKRARDETYPLPELPKA